MKLLFSKKYIKNTVWHYNSSLRKFYGMSEIDKQLFRDNIFILKNYIDNLKYEKSYRESKKILEAKLF